MNVIKPEDSEHLESHAKLGSKEAAADNVIQLKIVYWGPGESGKTTNFRVLRNNLRLVPLSFEFPIGDVKYTIITQIVTCTGQERFLATREYVLNGADGVVFIGDSNPEKLEENKRSFRELVTFTNEKNIPYLVQLNKRDLLSAISVEDFKKYLGLPYFEEYSDGTLVIYPAIATKGESVMNTFWDLIFQVLLQFFHQ